MLLLIINLAGQRAALLASEVESVVEIEGLTPIPLAAPHVVGLTALRSRVLTVIDCDRALGSERGGAREGGDAIVVVVDGHPYALLLDSVEDVVEASGEMRPLRNALSVDWSRVSKGVVEADGDILLVLDPQALIAGPIAAAA